MSNSDDTIQNDHDERERENVLNSNSLESISSLSTEVIN